jgi:hypothetical protein
MTSVLRNEKAVRPRVEVLPPLRQRSLPHKIWVERGRLYYDWEFDRKKTPDQKRANFEGALDAFKNIEDEVGVRKFARRYGPLFLCRHDKPYTHNPPAYNSTGDGARGCRPRNWRELPAWEPVSAWLMYAERTRELLRAAANLHLNKLDDRDWEVLTGRPRDLASEQGWEKAFGRRVGSRERLNNARLLLSMDINQWIGDAAVRPTFWWLNDAPDIRLAGSPLGMIAIQLAAEVSQAPAFNQCDGCKQPYFRQGKKPQSGRRNFCPDCGHKVANRLGQRDFRRRKRRDV